MYSTLIHVIGISILEILFYFIYIGPYETEMYMESIKDIIKLIIDKSESFNNNQNKKIKINKSDLILLLNDNNFNISLYNNTNNNFIINLNDYTSSYHVVKEKRIYNNHQLFINTILYLLMSILLITFIIFLFNYYKKFKNNKTYSDNDLIELKKISIKFSNENTNENTNENDINSNNNFFNKNRKEIIHYFMFSILLFAFEYIFFKFIILNYFVLSNEEMEYLLIYNLYNYYQDKIVIY